VFTLGAFVRRDQFNYYPSADPFADLGPINLQRETVAQNRTLTNAGLRSDISYVKGINNLKAGAVYEQTFLDEHDPLGIVDPTLNAPCVAFSAAQNMFPYKDSPIRRSVLESINPIRLRTSMRRTPLSTQTSIPSCCPTT
jgi:hypothetical protein